MHSIHHHFNEQFRKLTNSACDDVAKKLGELLVQALDKPELADNGPAFVDFIRKEMNGYMDICIISAAAGARDETREYMKGLNTMSEQEIVELIFDDDATLDYVINPTDAMESARGMRRL